jgi:hypothetical protein
MNTGTAPAIQQNQGETTETQSAFLSMVWVCAFVAIGLPESLMPFMTAILAAAYREKKSRFEMADAWLIRYLPGDPFAGSTSRQRTNHANYQRRRLMEWQKGSGVELVTIHPGAVTYEGVKIRTRYQVNFLDFLAELEDAVCQGAPEEEIRRHANRIARAYRWHKEQWKSQIKQEKTIKAPKEQLKTARMQAFGAITRIESLNIDEATRNHVLSEIQRRLSLPAPEPEFVSPLEAIDALTTSLWDMLVQLPAEEQNIARICLEEKGIYLVAQDEEIEENLDETEVAETDSYFVRETDALL